MTPCPRCGSPVREEQAHTRCPQWAYFHSQHLLIGHCQTNAN